ncbi:MAG TPA: PilZ domain-containing protein [Anaeromyxobacter sp.]|nr:PilZ domain-containing protein [Anaeromyxobacter sp.]
MSQPTVDRRRFHRVRVPILVRPAGPLTRVAPRQVGDISLGGMRAYSDEKEALGTRLELELFLPAGASVTCLAEIVWIEPLAEGAPARFEMGLRFVQVEPEELNRIAAVLED